MRAIPGNYSPWSGEGGAGDDTDVSSRRVEMAGEKIADLAAAADEDDASGLARHSLH